MDASSSREKPAVGLFAGIMAVAAIAAVTWWFWPQKPKEPEASAPPGSGILEPFRTPGGSLHTNGITKTEELRQETGNWRGTTSSGIRLNATYRYEIELRKSWNIYFDDIRGIAFVIAPPISPQLPVAVDSKSVQTWTESGYLKFDKYEHLAELHKEVSPFLEAKARSRGYRNLALGDARTTVEEFVRDWIVKNKNPGDPSRIVIKVFFSDEKDIPYPDGKSLTDFLP